MKKMTRSCFQETQLLLLLVSASFFIGFASPCRADNARTAALELFAEHRYADGLTPLRMAAESGNRDARQTLGMMLLYGHSLYNAEVPTNRSEGLRWLRLAAADGCEVSQYVLAKMKSP